MTDTAATSSADLAGAVPTRRGMHWFWKLFWFLFLLGSAVAAGASAWVWYKVVPTLPDIEDLRTVKLEEPLRIFSQNDELLGAYGIKRRIPKRFDEFPQTLIDAVLATEDQRFFSHYGVDPKGIARAVVGKLMGRNAGGGSTVTMQVARNFFLSREQTYKRKFDEILLSLKIEMELEKEEIMELYLNKIFMGHRAYGAAAAAQVYYGKSLDELTLAETAMLAGIPQAPGTNNPITNPSAAKKRRNHVLRRMQTVGKITPEQYEQAKETYLTARKHQVTLDLDAAYVGDMVYQEILQRFGKSVIQSGRRVYTSIDPTLQRAANRAVRNGLLGYERRHGYVGPLQTLSAEQLSDSAFVVEVLETTPRYGDLEPAVVTASTESAAAVALRGGQTAELSLEAVQWAAPRTASGDVGKAPTRVDAVLALGDVVYLSPLPEDAGYILAQLPSPEAALVALDTHTGAIRALVGGFDFYRSKYNRVTQSERQAGSSFKPFVYSAALEVGDTLATIYNDAPVVYEDVLPGGVDWRPENFGLNFYGPTRLRRALVKSMNLVSIRVMQYVGIDRALRHASKFGFDTARYPRDMSLSLGSGSVTPMQLASAYGVFANGGYLMQPYFIERIEEADGTVVFEAAPQCTPFVECAQSAQTPAISEGLAFLMRSALRSVVQSGTATKAKALNRSDIGGKTGTTNDQIDAWFAGFHPQLSVVTWMGYDDNRPLGKKETGGGAALPVWIDFMRTALEQLPEIEEQPPRGVVSARIDPESGEAIARGGVREYFLAKNAPSAPAQSVAGNSAERAGGSQSTAAVNEDVEGLF